MALIICSECGKEYSNKAMACPNCGNPTHTVSTYTRTSYPPVYPNQTNDDLTAQYINKLFIKEQTSGIIWIAITALQVLCFFFVFWFLFAAILSGTLAYTSFKRAKKIQTPYHGMVFNYDKYLRDIILALIFNLIFGGLFSIAGSIYDLCTRNYVLANREIFESIESETSRKKEENFDENLFENYFED